MHSASVRRNTRQALVLILIDLCGQRNKRFHHLRRQQVGMHAQIGQRLGQFRRMNRIRRERPALIERSAGAMVVIGNHHAVDRLGGMAGPPADHDAAQIVLIENVPQRFRFSREVRHRLHAASIRSWLGETVDAMLERPLSGGDGCPQHRRERRMQRRDLPHRAVFHQPLDVGHFARVHQRMDDLPVGGIPPDQQNSYVEAMESCLRSRSAGPSIAPQQTSQSQIQNAAAASLRAAPGCEKFIRFCSFHSRLTVRIGRL